MSSIEPKTDLSFRLCVDPSDLPHILRLAEEAHHESRLGHIPFSEEKVRKLAAAAFKKQDRQAVMLAFKSDLPVGIAYCSIGEYHIGSGLLLTTIHNINVTRSVRETLSGGKVALGLFRGIETWSKARGASEILLHVTSGVHTDRAHKLAKRLGYKFIGGSYAKTS